ncbi:MAG: hypothetical protein R3C18_14115 [Planctomycetaceae bacterium]
MIITLTIRLGSEWSADIEIEDESVLEHLHWAIQKAVNFDNDHLYEFYVARHVRAYNRVRYDDENGGLYETKLANLFPLPPKQQLFYLFDYGDSWLFRVSKSRKRPQNPAAGVKYPRVVKETGKKPIQYEPFDEDFD